MDVLYTISALYFTLFKTMGRKYVVPNCRSGLQPNKKEVEDLAAKDASDNSGRKISIFKFPKDECMLQKWNKAIPREGDHWATSYNGVCELHFQKEDFFNPDSNMHGNSRQRSAIRPEAIPRTFQNCPKYLSKERPTPRSENISAKARHENQMKRLEEVEQVFNIIDQVSTLTDLIQKLSGEKLPDGFRTVEMSLLTVKLR